MQTDGSMRFSRVSILVILTAIVVSLVTYELSIVDPGIVEENRLIEWLQALMLMLAAMAHGARGLRAADHSVRIVRWFMGLLCLSIVLREVDVDELADLEYLRTLELTLRWLMVGVWILYCWWYRHGISPLWAKKRAIVTSQSGLFSCAGCLFYLASWPIDRHLTHLGQGSVALVEETLELNATIFLLAGAIFMLPNERAPQANP